MRSFKFPLGQFWNLFLNTQNASPYYYFLRQLKNTYFIDLLYIYPFMADG